tara:strand:- start:621 stop:842 length:222 start_codon:yes stop_codon:yes gene_type:complete
LTNHQSLDSIKADRAREPPMSKPTETVILDEKATEKFRKEETTGDVAPCNTCGNDWTASNCSCGLPQDARYDW